MENKKRFELNDGALDAVAGGTDPNYYRNCTDFRCWRCGYKKQTREKCPIGVQMGTSI